MALINCPRCGKQISNRAAKCPHCGFVPTLTQSDLSASLSEQQEAAPKKSKKKWWIAIVTAALLAGIAVLRFFVFNKNHDTKTPEPSSSTISEPIGIDVSEIEQMLNLWVEYHNDKNVPKLMTLYADQVEYYLTSITKDQVCTSKQKALDKNPQFQMALYNVIIDKQSSCYKVTFDKQVRTNPQENVKTYRSYLYVQQIGNSWKIIKESDEVTERKKATENSQNNYVVIDGSELRLRLGPSLNADTFKWKDGTNRHPKVGEKFKYLDETSDFYQIDYQGNRLWVSKLYTHIEQQ